VFALESGFWLCNFSPASCYLLTVREECLRYCLRCVIWTWVMVCLACLLCSVEPLSCGNTAVWGQHHPTHDGLPLSLDTLTSGFGGLNAPPELLYEVMPVGLCLTRAHVLRTTGRGVCLLAHWGNPLAADRPMDGHGRSDCACWAGSVTSQPFTLCPHLGI
jgi:hypothetical protein